VGNVRNSDSWGENPIGKISLPNQSCQQRSFQWASIVATVGLLILAGCRTPPPAPIDYRPPPPSEKITSHQVSSGETLFSIAWRYEKDVQKLARSNGISYPYTIYQGQQLTLDTTRVPKVTSRPPASSSKSSSSKGATSKSTSSSPPKTSTQPRPKVTAPPPRKAPILPSNWRWQWPTTGRVVKRFNSTSLFKGVDIQSHSGAPVVVAAPGVVVYSGSGLRGYGKLIIVKHSDVFLSAYAHNRKIFVREGQELKAGQKISEVGGDPSDKKRLYFEIRKDGKPVDPLRYLPKR
jgi:lipoprotein NlpD